MPRSSYLQSLTLAAVLLASACSQAPTAGVSITSTSFKGAADISGTARVPSNVLSAVAAPLIANNGSSLVTDLGSGIVASNTSRMRLFAIGDENPLPDALVYLTDPKDHFYRINGHMIDTITNADGEYRFQSGVPQKVAVIVNAILSGNRRLVGFCVPNGGPQKVDLSVASTYVTEFLRQQAEGDNKDMSSYDLKQLDALASKTQALLQASLLDVPDLDIGHIPDLDRAYALTVGTTQDLGDAWASLLGRRILALQTVAGDGNSGSSGDGGPATSAEFYRPRDAVSDKNGNIYIADEGNNEVRLVDAKTGRVTTVAGTGKGGFGGDGGPATQALLNTPRSVALDARGNLFIVDQANARIRRVDAVTHVITTIAGNPPPDGAGGWQWQFGGDGGQATLARLYQPRCMAFDGAGNLYFSDAEHDTIYHTIRKIDMTTGIITTVVGVPGQPGAFDGDGGKPSEARLSYPNEIVFDSQGRLIIADTGNNAIRRVDFKADTITTIAGIGGQSGDDPDGNQATKTRLNSPYGVCVASDGRLFISERATEKVVTVGPDGIVHTVAGGGTDVREGDARRTKLTQPHDVWISPDGNVLVADTRGSFVRRLVTRFGL